METQYLHDTYYGAAGSSPEIIPLQRAKHRGMGERGIQLTRCLVALVGAFLVN